MKTLIIVTHPHIEDSLINKRWIKELEKYPEQYTIHQLYKVYPDEHIDVRKEQQLIEQYDHIVFQFPLYWFSTPPLLKKWQDEVLTYGWAYGSKSGYKVGGKKVTLAISAGIDEREYARITKNINTPLRNYYVLLNSRSNTFTPITARFLPITASS